MGGCIGAGNGCVDGWMDKWMNVKKRSSESICDWKNGWV